MRINRMIAFQCSKCKHLEMADDICWCGINVDPNPKSRDKDDRKTCLMWFEELEEEKRWHEKCSWEK